MSTNTLDPQETFPATQNPHAVTEEDVNISDRYLDKLGFNKVSEKDLDLLELRVIAALERRREPLDPVLGNTATSERRRIVARAIRDIFAEVQSLQERLDSDEDSERKERDNAAKALKDRGDNEKDGTDPGTSVATDHDSPEPQTTTPTARDQFLLERAGVVSRKEAVKNEQPVDTAEGSRPGSKLSIDKNQEATKK